MARKQTAKDKDRARRMAWWHQAKFGMFIHFGLYSILGRHEWAMDAEAIPVAEYEPLAHQFKPKAGAPRAWARLARQAGMKYMVLTTKHHEGFCLWDTATTDFCAPRQACGRDLVAEYVRAARAEGMGVGFYFSLMDWHHPDGQKCATDQAARRRFLDYVQAQLRELCTQYGKVDILWYDVPMPLREPELWESARMNAMVRRLQPDIIINNRSRLPEDFGTPEQKIVAEPGGRAWESCMTMNDSWGYHAADDAWKTPKQIIRNLITCARNGGNYLLNIGPRSDGSIPEESVHILKAVGKWMAVSGKAIYGADRCAVRHSQFAGFSTQGKKLYVHCYFWPGQTWSVGGLKSKVKSARILASGQKLKFEQTPLRFTIFGAPARAPQDPVTTIVLDCAGKPVQGPPDELRGLKKRQRVNMAAKK
ncbi:MAG: alpha-L-fucosidase [Phycisphaerae bacterium]|jgi:alpha-L-fucosidase